MSVRKLGVSTLPKGASIPWIQLDVKDLDVARQRLKSAPEICTGFGEQDQHHGENTLRVQMPCPDEDSSSLDSGSLSDYDTDEVRSHLLFFLFQYV